MGKQLEDLIESFTDMSPDEQLARIERVRDTRTIERPAVARRRRVKEKSKSEKAKTKLKALMKNMTPEEKEAFLAKFGGGNGEA